MCRRTGPHICVGQGPEEEGDVILLEAEQEEQRWWGFKGIEQQGEGGVWAAGSYQQVKGIFQIFLTYQQRIQLSCFVEIFC